MVAGLSRDAVVAGTAKGILSSMPRAWDMPSVRKGLGSVICPTEVVLLQELERYNQVCHPDPTLTCHLQLCHRADDMTKKLIACARTYDGAASGRAVHGVVQGARDAVQVDGANWSRR